MIHPKRFTLPLLFILIGAVLTIISYFLDDYIILIFQSIRNPFLTWSLDWLTQFRSIFFVLLVFPTIFLWENKKTKFIAPLWNIALITIVLESILKYIILRRRPFGIEGTFGVIDSSFPSAHAAIAFALAFILAKAYPKLSVFWYILALGVAVSRLYFELHYLSDVIGGAFIGLTISSLILIFSHANKDPKISAS